ncbi:alkyl hydroperoxide reductase subunit F [Granulicoccus phenolivorans]|uniref:alkyl hydroperoxide reductase subunit F n=1 Tax=Granulicoccus phenolivorans TaxID=266854 RepID=UPI000410D099|nr:alkyl hydroperoxide reductase subunit F [Granulicoccus phenolivorans]
MLDENLQVQLKQLLTNLKEPIELQSSLDDSAKSTEMATLLDEVAAQSDLVTVRRTDDNERRPSFAIVRPGSDISVRFAGSPLGHEFSSLVLALLHVGGHQIKEEQEVMDAVRNLPGKYEFTTYISLTCTNCPTVVQALNSMAVLNPNITHVAVEGGTFKEEVTEQGIMAVPTIYLNGEEWGSGRMGMAEIVAKLDVNAGARATESLNHKEPYDMLIVGGGPAGAAASIYAARKGLRVGLAGERMGGQVLDTNAIENLITVPYTEGPELGAALEKNVHEYNVDVMSMVVANKLIPGDKGELHTVEFEGGGALKAKTVIIATGARWRRLGVPGEEEYRTKGVTFCPHCDGPMFAQKPVAVIGGGNSGIEAALDLSGVVKDVTVLEFLDSCRADDILMKKAEAADNIKIITNAATKEVTGDGKKATGLTYTDRATDTEHSIDLDGVFVQIGLLPSTEWLAGSGVELSDRKEVVIGHDGSTNIPGIYAAGDVTTEPFKQIVISLGGGATAALSAFNYLMLA